MDERYHNCRWCSNQRKGQCPFMPVETESELEYAIDEGQLMEVLEESVPSKVIGVMQAILEDINMPAKHKRTIMSELQDWNWHDDIDDLDTDIHRWIHNHNTVYSYIDVTNQDFYCNHFR